LKLLIIQDTRYISNVYPSGSISSIRVEECLHIYLVESEYDLQLVRDVLANRFIQKRDQNNKKPQTSLKNQFAA